MELIHIPIGDGSGMTIEVQWPALYNTIRISQLGDIISITRDQLPLLIEALQKTRDEVFL